MFCLASSSLANLLSQPLSVEVPDDVECSGRVEVAAGQGLESTSGEVWKQVSIALLRAAKILQIFRKVRRTKMVLVTARASIGNLDGNGLALSVIVLSTASYMLVSQYVSEIGEHIPVVLHSDGTATEAALVYPVRRECGNVGRVRVVVSARTGCSSLVIVGCNTVVAKQRGSILA